MTDSPVKKAVVESAAGLVKLKQEGKKNITDEDTVGDTYLVKESDLGNKG